MLHQAFNSQDIGRQLINAILGISQFTSKNNEINDLTNALNELSVAANKVSLILKNISTTANQNSYNVDNSSSNNPSSKQFHYVNAVKKPSQVNVNNVSSRNEVSQNITKTANPFMSELANLKNLRNDAYYKCNRNGLLIKLLSNNLKKEPTPVPKKFAPSFTRHDSNEIREHKIEMCKQRVINEIKTMKIHEDIQRKRMEMYDKKVHEHINTEPNLDKREKLLDSYEKIVAKHDQKFRDNWRKKESFFNSNAYNFFIKNQSQKKFSDDPKNQNTALNNNETLDNLSEDSDCDDISLNQIYQMDEINKSLLSSRQLKINVTEPIDLDDTSAKRPLSQPYTQPPRQCKSLIPISKNFSAPATKTREKVLSQQL
jgi:hypothetical protein